MPLFLLLELSLFTRIKSITVNIGPITGIRVNASSIMLRMLNRMLLSIPSMNEWCDDIRIGDCSYTDLSSTLSLSLSSDSTLRLGFLSSFKCFDGYEEED